MERVSKATEPLFPIPCLPNTPSPTQKKTDSVGKIQLKGATSLTQGPISKKRKRSGSQPLESIANRGNSQNR